jgi:hypothetical protein
MAEQNVPQAQVIELNEIGFNDTPTFPKALKWFINKGFKFYLTGYPPNNAQNYIYVITKSNGEIDKSEEYNTYDEAQLACLIKLIEIVRNNEQQ